MGIMFEYMDTMVHQWVAHLLSKFVMRRATDAAIRALNDSTLSLGNSFGNVTLVVPVTRFASVDDVERIANDLELAAAGGPVSAHPEMYGIFYELGLNAVQHSQSVVGCYVVSQLGSTATGEVAHTIGVADCGIGIPASLRRNPDFAHIIADVDAIELATELHITGTGDAHRGIGLDHVKEAVRISGGNWIVVSGRGFLDSAADQKVPKGTLAGGDQLHGTIVVVTLSGQF